ncbi:MAG: polysaccharide deacetylase family protein [Bacillota bacterium]
MITFLKKVVSRLSMPGLKYNTTPVLGYHSVHPDHPLAVRPDMFRERIRFLKENFEVISLAEYVRRKLTGELTEGTAAVTFDDGYEDNYRYAYPVLKEFSCPATLFLVTRSIQNRQGCSSEGASASLKASGP